MRHLLFLFLLMNLACSAQEQHTEAPYTYMKGDPNGIGKWYMGREIAHVMGHQAMDWLERSEREEEEKTSKLLKNMDLQLDDTIADIGAGSGYHVFKMSPLVSEGLIYAVDIQDEMLEAIEQKKSQSGRMNIKVIKGSISDTHLPPNSVDKVLMVDVYHEFDHPVEMMASIAEALRPGGELFLIEYRAEDDWVPIKPIHKMSEAQAVKEMEAAGLTLKRNVGNLPWQHCMVFVKE